MNTLTTVCDLALLELLIYCFLTFFFSLLQTFGLLTIKLEGNFLSSNST